MDARSLRNIIVRVAQKIYPRIGLRDSDVILASFPKSGNTWFRFIWANMISLMELGGREIDFHYLNKEMAAEYDSSSYGPTCFQSLPRVVKTHHKYVRGAFSRNRSIYLIRHPGDVAVSYHAYMTSKKSSPVRNIAFSEFIREADYGIPAWCRHVHSWRYKSDAILRYEDLKEDAVRQLSELLCQLGVDDVRQEVIAEAVCRSTFENMRRVEEERGRPTTDKFEEGFRFTRRGQTGEWRMAFSGNDYTFLRAQLKRWNLLEMYALS